jgi:hypothetical protein
MGGDVREQTDEERGRGHDASVEAAQARHREVAGGGGGGGHRPEGLPPERKIS